MGLVREAGVEFDGRKILFFDHFVELLIIKKVSYAGFCVILSRLIPNGAILVREKIRENFLSVLKDLR